MPKLALVMVEGDNATVQEALKAGFALIDRTGQGEPVPIAAPAAPSLPAGDQAEVTAIAQSMSEGKVKRAVAAVRNDVGGTGRRPYDGPPLKCRHCDRYLKSPQARGKHESSEHGIKPTGYVKKADRKPAYVPPAPKPAAATVKLLPCGMNGCFTSFSTAEKRAAHWNTAHGK